MILLPFETLMFRIFFLLILLVTSLLYLKGIKLNFNAYLDLFLLAVYLIGIGQVMRRSESKFKYKEGISLFLNSAGLFVLYYHTISLFGLSLFPIVYPRIDHILIAVDSIFGFQWQEFATFFSHIPYSAEVMLAIYNSVGLQIAVIIFAQSFSNRTNDLGKFLLTGIFGAYVCIAVWFFFPSFGPASVFDLPDDVLARMPISAGPDYGKHLLKLSMEGIDVANPEVTKGAIAFPSFHMVLALTCMTFSRPFKTVWPIFIVLNILMIPCIIVQGGHHLIDLFGGAAVFFIAYFISAKLMRKVGPPATRLGSESKVSGLSVKI